jgi:class 3 adenylate cyclase
MKLPFLKKMKMGDVRTKANLVALLFVAIGALFANHSIVQKFEAATWMRVQFEVREFFGLGAKIDPRVKVIWFGDNFVRVFGGYDNLTAEYWNTFFEKIAESKPKAIVVDGLMSTAKMQESWRWAQYPHRESYELSNGVKVFTGIALKDYEKNIGVEARDALSAPGALLHGIEGKDFRPRTERVEGRSMAIFSNPYWNNIAIAKGHIQYDNDNRRTQPYYRVQDLGIIPHLGIGSVEGWQMGPKGPMIDDQLIPSSPIGMIVNYIHPDRYSHSQKSGLAVLSSIVEKKKVDWISEGDYVFVAPLMWTGHLDKVWTPFGITPGSLAVMSVLNSSLQKKWISEPLGQIAPVLIASFLFIVLVLLAPISSAGYLLIASVALWAFISLILFSFLSIYVPTTYPLFVSISAASVLFFRKVQIEELAIQSIKMTLSGKISDQELELATKRMVAIDLEVKEHVVTIIFVDIVGYSAMSEELSPLQAFEDLKMLLNDMRDIVHKHGGVVDKTLGDGLLAYFGYSVAGGRTTETHAVNALSASLEIQKNCILRTIAPTAERIYPMRIGVNTTSCLIGNLGNKTNIDVTLVGHGVNLAKRLEGAADPHHILMSALTWELVSSELKEIKGARKEVRLKHHNDYLTAIEVRPNEISEEDYKKAVSLGGQVLKKRRKSARHDFSAASGLQATFSNDKVTLLNFSLGGMSVKTSIKHVKGDHALLIITSIRKDLQDKLNQCLPNGVKCTIQWAVIDNGAWVIGFSYDSLTEDERESLYNVLINEIN